MRGRESKTASSLETVKSCLHFRLAPKRERVRARDRVSLSLLVLSVKHAPCHKRSSSSTLDGVMKRVGYYIQQPNILTYPLVTSASFSLDYKIAARNKNGGLLEVLGWKSMSLFGSSAANTVT